LPGVAVIFGAATAFVVLTGFALGVGFAVFVLVSLVMAYIPFAAFSKKSAYSPELSMLSVAKHSGSETLGQHTVAQAAVADGETLLPQLLHHRAHDAGTGEDDLRPLRLKADDGAAGIGIE